MFQADTHKSFEGGLTRLKDGNADHAAPRTRTGNREEPRGTDGRNGGTHDPEMRYEAG